MADPRRPWPPECPSWLSIYPRLDSRYVGQGRLLSAVPDLLVIHSGEIGENVARYLHRCNDGRVASAHFAATRAGGGFVQMESLRRQTFHAAGSTFRGRRAVNARSWSIECPGPWKQNPRPEGLRVELRALVALLVEISEGGLRWWTRHSTIRKTKRDPGPGFLDSWMDGLGLEFED